MWGKTPHSQRPGERAIGKRIVDRFSGFRTVVGVVSDARMRGLGRIHSEMLRDSYVTLDQSPTIRTNVFVRTAAVMPVKKALAVDPSEALRHD